MAIKKSELYSSIWKSCDELRGGMDASQYKDYVLVLLFVKYVSDKYAGQPDALIEVPPGGGFADMVALKGDKDIGEGIAKAVKKLNREVVILASSDMTHYEPQESARRKDNQAIEAILNLDADELLERIQKLDISMCGYAPVAILIAAAKELGAAGVELVGYQTSGDAISDYSSVVGYAGVIIKGISP